MLESRRLFSSPSSTVQFPVDNTTGAQSDPDVAINAAGQAVIVWDTSPSNFGTPQTILAQRLDPSGQPVGSPIPVSQATIVGPGDPSVALNADGSFVVTWQTGGDASDILARRFDAQGQPLGDAFDVATISSGEQLSPDVATDGSGNFTIVWFNGFGGDPAGVDARRFGTDGTPLGLQFRVNAPQNIGVFPAIAQQACSGEFVIAWMSWNQPQIGIHAQRFDSSGSPLGEDLLVDPRVASSVNTSPAARAVDVGIDSQGNFVVGWFGHDRSMPGDDDAAFVRRFSASGEPLSATILASADSGVQSVGLAMQPDGSFAIAWHDGSGTTRARRFHPDATPATNSFVIASGTSRVPAIAADPDGNLLFAWRAGIDRDGPDVYARWRRPEAIPPLVIRTDFEDARRQQVVIQFSEDVSSSLTPDDIGLINRTTGQMISSGQLIVSYDIGSDTAMISLPNMVLPDGNYRAAIPEAGVTDVTGNALVADVAIDFFVLAGDANHDGTVDVSDLGVLATNWQQSGATIDFARGDFNYDHVVDVTDLGILATNWQKPLLA